MGVSGRPTLACACEISEPDWSSEALSFSKRHATAAAEASVMRKNRFVEGVILVSFHYSCWNFIDIGQYAEVDLFCVCRRLEFKGACSGLIFLPVPNNKRVLRGAGDSLAGDDVFAWDGTIANCYP